MPTTPYATLLASIAAGAATAGGATATPGQTCQLSGESTVGWTAQLFEIYSYPAGFAAPAGWSTDAAGVYFYSTTSTPPLITLSAATTPAKYLFRLTVNNGLDGSGVASATLVDEATAVRVAGVGGLHAFAPGETSQWSTASKWAGDLRADIVLLDTAVAALPVLAAPTVTVKSEATAAGAGVAATILRTDAQLQAATAAASSIGTANTQGAASTLARSDHGHNHGAQTEPTHHAAATAIAAGFVTLGGDLAGTGSTGAAPRTSGINGTTVNAGGALAVGQVLRATGAAAAEWGALNLADTDAVTGALPDVNQADQTMAGDVSGSTGSSTVDAIRGTSVSSAGGALVTGAVLRVTGVSSCDWGAVNLADTDAVTGVLPVANVDATATPTASKIAMWNASVYMGATRFYGSGTVATAGLLAAANNVVVASARNAANGANIALLTTDGADKLTVGDASNASGVDVSALTTLRTMIGAAVSTHATANGLSIGLAPSFGSGVGMVGIANAGTEPTTAPVACVLAYPFAGAVKAYSPKQVRTTLAPEANIAATEITLPRFFHQTHTSNATITAALITITLPTSSSFSMTVKVSAQVTTTDTRAHYKRLIRGGRGGAGNATIDDAATIGVDFDAIGLAAVPTIVSDGASAITIKFTGKAATEVDVWIMVDDCVIYSA